MSPHPKHKSKRNHSTARPPRSSSGPPSVASATPSASTRSAPVPAVVAPIPDASPLPSSTIPVAKDTASARAYQSGPGIEPASDDDSPSPTPQPTKRPTLSPAELLFQEEAAATDANDAEHKAGPTKPSASRVSFGTVLHDDVSSVGPTGPPSELASLASLQRQQNESTMSFQRQQAKSTESFYQNQRDSMDAMTSVMNNMASLFQNFTDGSKASRNDSVEPTPLTTAAGHSAPDTLPTGLQVPAGSHDDSSLSAPSASPKFHLSEVAYNLGDACFWKAPNGVFYQAIISNATIDTASGDCFYKITILSHGSIVPKVAHDALYL